jgi:hypothetical protein
MHCPDSPVEPSLVPSLPSDASYGWRAVAFKCLTAELEAANKSEVELSRVVVHTCCAPYSTALRSTSASAVKL